MSEKPKRRWYQFSIRALGLLMTVCAVMAWVENLRRRGMAQRHLVQSLQTSQEYRPHDDVVIKYDFQRRGLRSPRFVPTMLIDIAGVDCFANVVGIEINRKPSGPEEQGAAGLRRLRLLPALEVLSLWACMARDDDLPLLNHHQYLSRLELGFCNISGSGFRNASYRTGLRALVLNGCPVTDEGLAVIGKFENLEELSLCGNGFVRKKSFTSKGIEQLRQLTHLRKLDLAGIEITDLDLAQIAKLSSLEDLTVEILPENSKESIRGLRNLKRLRRLGVFWDFVIFIHDGHQEQVFAILEEIPEKWCLPERVGRSRDWFWSPFKDRLKAHATVGTEWDS